MNCDCSGISARACSAEITRSISITPMIAPFWPPRCRAIGPVMPKPHERFSMRFSPLAICEAKGSLTDSVFMQTVCQNLEEKARKK
jgi:hypothetical protein